MTAGRISTAVRLERGRRLFNAGMFFEAHEVWEEAWLSETGPTRRLLQGLIQITAGFHKAVTLRQSRGCVRLLEAGLAKLDEEDGAAHGLSLGAFRDEVSRGLAEARRWLRGETGAPGRASVPCLDLETSEESG